jgi:hypothetical protein
MEEPKVREPCGRQGVSLINKVKVELTLWADDSQHGPWHDSPRIPVRVVVEYLQEHYKKTGRPVITVFPTRIYTDRLDLLESDHRKSKFVTVLNRVFFNETERRLSWGDGGRSSLEYILESLQEESSLVHNGLEPSHKE